MIEAPARHSQATQKVPWVKQVNLVGTLCSESDSVDSSAPVFLPKFMLSILMMQS